MYQNSNKIPVQKFFNIYGFQFVRMFACIEPKTWQKMKDLKVVADFESSTQRKDSTV